MPRILAINGSLRTGSHNGALLRAAAALLPSGAELAELTGLAHLPAYSEDGDVSPPPPTVAALRGALASADAVLISTPEYNSSIPGQLKNALDWASRPFPDNALRGKPEARNRRVTKLDQAFRMVREQRKAGRWRGHPHVRRARRPARAPPLTPPRARRMRSRRRD